MTKAEARAAYEALMKFYPLTLEDLGGELWKWIPSYEGHYQCSNYGRVKSFKCKTPRILSPMVNALGYLPVNLHKNGKQKTVRVHQLVALCFIPNPDSKPEINHIDGHPMNNHVSNLEWCTRSENAQHAHDIGLAKNDEGGDDSQAKLTNEQARYIRDNPEGLTGNQLAKIFGVDPKVISRIQLGKAYRNAGGVIRKSKAKHVPPEIRKQICAEYIKGSWKFGSVALAKKYGVDPTTISRIVKEK